MKKYNSKLGVSALILLFSGIVCKALGALFRLPLTNLLGIEGIGVFQLVMSLYAFALVFTCGGVTNSLSKLISSARARGDFQKVGTFFKRAMVVSIGIGLLLGLLFALLGKYISFFQGVDASYCYMLFFLLLPLGAGLATFRGFFQGYENMFPTAISQVVEQVFKFVFGLMFAFYFGKLGLSQGVFGAFLGIVISELFALVLLFIIFFVKNKNLQFEHELQKVKFARREFDGANFPLMFSASILPLVNALDGLFIVPRLIVAGFSNGTAVKLFGLQSGVVGAILNFPLIISIAVTTTLLPNISYLISRGTGGKHIIERGLKVLLFLVLPTTFGMVAISRQVFVLFYKDLTTSMLNTSFNLMLYGGFVIIFTAIMQYTIMLLQANGQFKFILIITSIGGVAKILLTFFLSAIPNINIYAIVFGNIVLYAVVCILALWKLKRLISFSLKLSELAFLLFGTFCMFLTVYTFINCNYFGKILNLVVGVVLGILVYVVTTVPFTIKLISKQNIFKKV